MDSIALIYGFGGGVFATAALLYGYAKSQGLISGDVSNLEAEVKAAVGNISISEVGSIFAESRKLLADDGTFTLKDAEKIGILVMDAAKSK